MKVAAADKPDVLVVFEVPAPPKVRFALERRVREELAAVRARLARAVVKKPVHTDNVHARS